MAGTILGKRARAAISDDTIGTNAKRCVRKFEVIENDENQSPEDMLRDGDEINMDCFPGTISHSDSSKVAVTIRSKRRSCSNHASPKKAVTTEIYNDEDATHQVPTPNTPRHRDALSKKAPLTPRHRVIVAGKSFTPHTPRTPSSPTTAALRTVFDDAKRVFARGANPTALVGRTNERVELRKFIGDHVASMTGGCLYVSGPPGTGKSALVTEICATFAERSSVRSAYVNCMSVKRAIDIYNLAANELNLSNDEIFDRGAEHVLQSAFLEKGGKMTYLVILDEIDQLLNLDDSVLYNLFQSSFDKHSKLVLIGIANALDFTDRFLPRLKARNLKPKLLPFLPYTAMEIASVLTSRVRSLLPEVTTALADFTPFLHPTAVQLISKKVAAQTGDLRKAFDIAQRAIEVVEKETREKHAQQLATEQQKSPLSPSRAPLGENPNVSSPTASTDNLQKSTANKRGAVNAILCKLTPETAPRATLPHVVRVTSAVFSNGTLARLKTLNLQQKAILCALVALEQKNIASSSATSSLPSPTTPSTSTRPNKQVSSILRTPTKQRSSTTTAAAGSAAGTSTTPTIRTLYETYTALCKRDNVLHALSSTEFRDVLANLETLSLVAAVAPDGKVASFASPAGTPSKRGRGAWASSTAGGGCGGVDERSVKACVGMADLQGVAEGIGSGVLKMILAGEGVL